MKRHLLRWGSAALMVGMLTACGGGGSSSTSDTGGSTATAVSGVASKGPINGGTVTIYALSADGTAGSQLGTATTAPDGTYSINIGTYNGNVLVVVTGGTYKDEATGIDTPNTTLRAALTGATGDVTVAVTPMTELAVRKAGSALTKSAIEDANSIISAMAGVDIIGTIPADATSGPGDNIYETSYSLMLAAISQMSNDNAMSVGDILDLIKSDLDDDDMANGTAPAIMAALENFIANTEANLSGVTDLTETNLDDAIDFIATTPIISGSGNTSDITKAKKLIANFRNTIMSVANYKGVGTAGMVESPFNRLSTELSTEIEPTLATAADRLVWILQSCTALLDHSSYVPFDGSGNTLTLNQTGNTIAFEVKDPLNTTLDSGSITINDLTTPTTGSLTGTISTPGGLATVDLDYTGTVTNSIISGVTFTGSITAPGLSIDFSQDGRKMSATIAPEPDNQPGDTDAYPTSVNLSARITTNTARFDGTLTSTIVWSPKKDIHFSCYAGPEPRSASFTGSFAEIISGTESGMKFTGTINADYINAATFDGCAGTSSTNFRKWDASFDGSIEAPSRPAIEVFLSASESQRGNVAVDASYRMTNTDGTVVSLSGSGNLISTSTAETQSFTFTNEYGLKLNFATDDNLPCTEKFTGTIKTSGGVKLADLYTISNPGCVPTVKYADDYFESIF